MTSVPRSITPVIINQNHTHSVPQPLKDEDRELLLRLSKMKDSEEARALWYDTDSLMQYPPFVDKALKLFNLKQVAHEIETSVMSKVSCTACRTGAGLLQHYIKSGRDKREIIKMIYTYCANLNIQSPRVCEGVSQQFGVGVKLVSSLTKVIKFTLLLPG